MSSTTSTDTSRESLWDFALRVYSLPGVEQSCLALQDRWGADVTLVLWLCWLAERGVPASVADIKAAERKTGPWQQQVVTALRRVRRQIKADWPVEDSAIQAVRSAVAEAELLAEKLALEWLERFELMESKESFSAETNLARYLCHLRVPEGEADKWLARLTANG
jgi:uncharacterized protein (TIGR02444 family)